MTSSITSVKGSQTLFTQVPLEGVWIFPSRKECTSVFWIRSSQAGLILSLMDLCLCSRCTLQFCVLPASQECFALPGWFQVWFSLPLPHIRWRCQIYLEIRIKTTFSAHSAFKDQCTPLWGQIGRGCRKRPGRMRNTLLITIQTLPVAVAQRTAQENWSNSLWFHAVPCSVQYRAEEITVREPSW